MNKRIMVIEDDECLRDLYQEVLEDEGYQVLAARDWVEGLRMMEHSKPDLLLLDLGLPVMDGLEVLARLDSQKEVRVIVLTSDPEYRTNPLCRAADDFVYKSVDLKELKQKVRCVLDSRASRKRLEAQGSESGDRK